MLKVTVGFTETWLIQLRIYRLQMFVYELNTNPNYRGAKLSSEEKAQYEKNIAICKQQAALFHHVAETLPGPLSQAIIQRYGQSTEADPLQVKGATKELFRILKAMLKAGDIQPIIFNGFHLIRSLKPVIAIEPTEEKYLEEDTEDLNDPNYIEWLMQKDY